MSFTRVPSTRCTATGKPGFPNRQQALKALGKVQAKRQRRGFNGRKMGRTFQCSECHAWHMTGRPRD